MIEQAAQAILAKMLEINSGIVGRPVEADEFDEMCAYAYARAALSAMPSRELLAEALEALQVFAENWTLRECRNHMTCDIEQSDILRARAAADKIRAAMTQEKQT